MRSRQTELYDALDLSGQISALRAEMVLIQWILGLLIGGVVALVIKAYF